MASILCGIPANVLRTAAQKDTALCRSNVLLVDENSRCDLLDTCGIRDGVDLDDLAIDDEEAHNIDGLSIYRDYYSGCPVH
jgi:hypothetical protein